MSDELTDPFPPDPGPFEVELVPERDGVRIVPAGALDMATVPILEAPLRQLRDSGVRRLLVDLRRLTFIDSTGLRLVLAYDADSRQDGFAFALIPGSPKVQRVFEITGTLDALPFVDP
jgi:anti-sigma B factor antagonist